MYFIPSGMMALQQTELLTSFSENYPNTSLENLILSGLFLKNLLPVTLGNMLGGGLFVGLGYWFIYLPD